MKKLFHAIGRFLPHMTVILSLMTLTFFCIDRVNTAMAFMTSEMSRWLFAILAVCSILCACMLIAAQWKDDARRARREARHRGQREKQHWEEI